MLKSVTFGVCVLALTASPLALAKKPINMDVPAQLTVQIDQSVRSTPPTLTTLTTPLTSADQLVTPAQAPTAIEAPAQPTEAPVVDPYAPTPAASAMP